MISGGIPYFPLDVNLDSKFELIEAEFGLDGFGVVVKLFQQIYGLSGYYLEWTNEVALLFAKKIGLGGSVVSEIVQASIRRGIFDRNLFEKYQILTSKGIQRRYFEAVSRRKQVKVKSEYLLVKVDQICKNVDISAENADISLKNANIFEQRKGEKRKEEERRGEKSIYQRIADLYNEICISFPKCISLSDARKKAIRARMNSGRTEEDFRRLFEMAEQSDFLKGKNSRNWSATFDWLLNDANMAKVLDGNYQSRSGKVMQPLLEGDDLPL